MQGRSKLHILVIESLTSKLVTVREKKISENWSKFFKKNQLFLSRCSFSTKTITQLLLKGSVLQAVVFSIEPIITKLQETPLLRKNCCNLRLK